MSKVLTHSTKSYIKIFFVGILVGCICRLADYFPADTLWSFSSIQTLLGFWIITNTTIVLLSTSNICAGISSFLYMFGMTLSFYGLQAILGMFVPLFPVVFVFRYSFCLRFFQFLVQQQPTSYTTGTENIFLIPYYILFRQVLQLPKQPQFLFIFWSIIHFCFNC